MIGILNMRWRGMKRMVKSVFKLTKLISTKISSLTKPLTTKLLIPMYSGSWKNSGNSSRYPLLKEHSSETIGLGDVFIDEDGKYYIVEDPVDNNNQIHFLCKDLFPDEEDEDKIVCKLLNREYIATKCKILPDNHPVRILFGGSKLSD
jgi:hypothetical protein